ncbi:MAG TPA: T9SS type A sorting domain-containing protein [Bacteroidia bacterium]|nr:T9SS type A sorting domain-containing protein [Bacteroidia bacterium]
MSKRCWLIILFLGCSICNAQNFVQNPGFEDYTGCPPNSFYFDSIQYWQNPTNGSPDYFKACANLVPGNWAAYQYAQSGDAYCGLVIKNSGPTTFEWREYIQSPLAAPLVAGTKYILSIYANLANYSQYGSSSIAGLFTTYPYFYNSNLAIPLTPQAINDTSVYITDTLGWQLIQMPFTADSNYAYVTIGNFSPDALTTYVLVQNNLTNERSYFLLDDISLVIDPNSGVNQTGLPGQFINIFPNPFDDKLNIEGKENGQSEIILYDVLSGKHLQKKFSNAVSLRTEHLAKGIYFYEVRNKNGVLKKGKVVKD